MLPTLLILSSLVFIALLPTLYIRFVLLRQSTSRWRWACWAPLAVFVLTCIFLVPFVYCAGLMRFFAFWVFCILLPLFVFAFVSAIGWCLSRKWPKVQRKVTFLGLGNGIAVFLLALYGIFFGWRELEVKQVDIYIEDLPEAFEGYRIAQLTDLHVGAYGDNTAFVERVVNETNALQPDMIVFTGDLININAYEAIPFETTLAQLKAKDGVLSILGNHDYCRYGFGKSEEEQQAGVEAVQVTERRMGWHLLVDEHLFVHRGTDSIALAGVGNISEKRHYGDLNKALNGLSDSVFTILLSHDPEHWRMEVLDHPVVHLTLSGHTHAAQVRIGRWSPAALFMDEWSGLYERDHHYLYVSEGLGGTFPFRLGATPQIVLITLHRK